MIISFPEPGEIGTFKPGSKIKASLGDYNKATQLCGESTQFKKGLVASRNLSKGHILSDKDIHYARPAHDFTAEKQSLIGKTVARNKNRLSHKKRVIS